MPGASAVVLPTAASITECCGPRERDLDPVAHDPTWLAGEHAALEPIREFNEADFEGDDQDQDRRGRAEIGGDVTRGGPGAREEVHVHYKSNVTSRGKHLDIKSPRSPRTFPGVAGAANHPADHSYFGTMPERGNNSGTAFNTGN
ncbi:hypothetical protein EKO27_g5472 [Xylaria grammica]|uniref:Uncharacterized protein n=1 Tax=Xylaria grammica TaxID=363999 RepID=A0A439D5F9_9PEZI|nr:hypothetical protein EKO27_g5472 [Xylaria grammica]